MVPITKMSVIKVTKIGRICHTCNGEIKKEQKFMSSGNFIVYGDSRMGYEYREYGYYVNTCKKCLKKLRKEIEK